MYPVKKMRRSMGLIYFRLDFEKRMTNQFIKDFLTAYDPELLKLYSKKKYDFKKRKEGKAFFIEGKELTMVILDNHFFIHASDEDEVINLLQSLIELTK
jgi:hypothetical protein